MSDCRFFFVLLYSAISISTEVVYVQRCLVVTWLVPRETAAVSARSVYTTQRAIAVTWGWNEYRNKGQQRKLTNGEKNKTKQKQQQQQQNSRPSLLPGLEPVTFRSRVRRSNH